MEEAKNNIQEGNEASALPAAETAGQETKASIHDVPAYQVGGVLMLTMLSFAVFLNVLAVGIALIVTSN